MELCLCTGEEAVALALPGLLPCMLCISTEITRIMHFSFKLHQGPSSTEEFAVDFLDYI